MYKARYSECFSGIKNILELHNTLNGTDYRNPEDLVVITLENAVYLVMKNAISFLLDGRMPLYEHQSTWTPNILIISRQGIRV